MVKLCYHYARKSVAGLAVAGLAVAAPAAMGTSIDLLPMGDSITFGVGTDTSGVPNNLDASQGASYADDNIGGYRWYLDSLLNFDHDFAGNRSTGDGKNSVGFADNQHFGVRSATSALDKTISSTFVPSMLTGIDNIATSPTSVDAAFNPGVVKPDAVMLHIGINDMSGLPSNLGGESQAQRADRLPGIAADGFADLLAGEGGRTGLVDRLTDTNYFASDAHLFVAFITPRTDDKGSTDLVRRQPALVAEYNSLIKAEIESYSGPGGDLEGRVTFVDLYSIRISDLDLNALASEFYSGEVDPMAALLAAISPEDDSLDGGADYVDWIFDDQNVGGEYDEGQYENGAFPGQELVASTNGESTNFALMEDGLHPTNLGAAIMAQQWANALNAKYIPEPGSAALMLAGSLLLMRRGKRRETA